MVYIILYKKKNHTLVKTVHFALETDLPLYGQPPVFQERNAVLFACKEINKACMAYLCLVEFKASMGSLSLPFFEIYNIISSYFLEGFHYNCLPVCLGELQFLGSYRYIVYATSINFAVCPYPTSFLKSRCGNLRCSYC